jgi:hypothetical protein
MAEIGFSGTKTASVVGISYRQLDYWARTDLVRPSLVDARGSGSRRLYSYRDLLELRVIKSRRQDGAVRRLGHAAQLPVGHRSPSTWPAGNRAVAFDVSHLGTVRVSGPDALGRLQAALTNDLTQGSGPVGPSTPTCSTRPMGRCSTTSSCGGSTTRCST